MHDEQLDLRPEAYAPINADVTVGDICEGVALPDPIDTGVYASDDLPRRILLAGRFVHALVVSVFNGYAVVAPVTTADVVSDHDRFAAVAAAGASARQWMRLPALGSAWHEDAVALLFMPQTLLSEAIADRRLASMHPTSREVVAKRFLRAVGGGDGL